MADTCAVPDCPKPRHQGGYRYCGMHARRLYVHGDLQMSLQPTWTAREDAVLLSLPRHRRSGNTLTGELKQAGLALGRTRGACQRRLSFLRARASG